MVFGIYSVPEEGKHWHECRLGDINDAESFEYTKYFCGAGTFSLVVPQKSPFADKIGINTIITESGEAFIVKNILSEDGQRVKVTGYDLNGLLIDRITLYESGNGADNANEGYDAAAGTTEACVKYYIDANFISSSVPERNLPRFGIAPDAGRGLPEDSYRARLECLDNVVRTLCGTAGLGYRIRVDPNAGNGDEPVFVFDVAEQIDRTAGQSERERVVFSASRKNVSGLKREIGVTTDKNIFYCELNENRVAVIDKNGNENTEKPPAAYGRREEYLALSCDDTAQEVGIYGRQAIKDNYAETDSLTIEAGDPLEYGVLYDVGDIVTVYDKAHGAVLDSVISAVTIRKSGTEDSVSITLGEAKPKLLDGYAKNTDMLKKNFRESKNQPATAEILHTSGSDIRADTKGGLVLRDENGTMRVVIDAGLSSVTNPPTPAVHILSNYGAGELLLGGGSALRITGDEFTVKQGSNVRFSADSGASWFVDIRGSSIHIRHDGVGSFILNADGFQADFAGGGHLAYDSTGFYVGGKKVLTE